MMARPGDYIKIISMKGEPHYAGRIGKVEHIDSIGQIHGDWGGCAVIPGEDEFEVLPKERAALFDYCRARGTNIKGMNMLCEFYAKSKGWSEAHAAEYAMGLLKDGTIDDIRFLGKDGEEL